MTKRGVIGLVGTALVLSAAPAFARGWVVRICRGETEASAIKISVGKPGSTPQLLVNWQSDNTETDFPVSKKLDAAKQLHVNADSEPADGKVAMCVLYKGTATKAMNFTDLLDVTAEQKGADANCKCPKSGKAKAK